MLFNSIKSSTAGLNSAPNVPETSSEILDDVLKQLDKLSPQSRKKVLDRLTTANLIGADLKTQTQTKQTSPSTTEAHRKNPTDGSQDEVEILDLHEPKMGSYKKKRSKLNLFKIYR